ncbi:type II secretion system F family protein [Lutimaribacter sp. EGI FJ00015]|uniref:Type II secretion system F family protein n=1 Tax=Lutimaribacter degradans TaxID=2945989 RepID=A0ACC5ZYD2_9RHOB|nr:type II secretion system F family protein [Lutimaribacter sp. EGI FJ00013]MCM2563359.1 type II secretion system F family protein [Lutimaribacter sp. EGI FJ00013]MCO0614563.1 type II secretion system F family protein [Lutimaribacter sp. EGI FJ00015]MCO0637235.1 type II secretion system F family protein [Lutimaribacter sp. EGI FJ00014]
MLDVILESVSSHPLIVPFIVAVILSAILWWLFPRLAVKRAMHRRIGTLPKQITHPDLGALGNQDGAFGGSFGSAERTRKALRAAPRLFAIRNLMEDSGLHWTRAGILLRLVPLTVVATVLSVLWGMSFGLALLVGFVLATVLLFLYAKRKQAKRLAAFEAEFASVLDIVIRGLRSGLPLQRCFDAVAASASEPTQSEFRRLVEANVLGTPLPMAVEQLAERVPLTEVRLFALIITIQQQTGGSLVESLSNLAITLRGRWELSQKVRTSSQEARASGMIVGAMPFVVAGGLYLVNPGYLRPLVETGVGLTVLVVSGLWMLLGIFIMWRMVNFDV